MKITSYVPLTGPALAALLLLIAPPLTAGPPASAKDVIAPIPAPFIPPPMFGDWIDPDTQPVAPQPEQEPSKTKPKTVLPVVTSYGPFKIAENESPLPQDRFFLTYNYYSDVLGSDFHRETLGMEKTFLDGDASIGLRVPFFQFKGDAEIDDLSLIFKYAFWRQDNCALSGGLAVTIPINAYETVESGDDEYIPLLQPFVGCLWQRGNFFVHGFSSVGVPTNDVLPVMLFNDLGIGYRFECDMGPVTAVVPTFEVHVNTPLNHRDEGDPERRRDSVDLTAGAHFMLGDKATFGLAVGTTVTHPRLFDVEALASLNVRF
jgi:hypothetical protein